MAQDFYELLEIPDNANEVWIRRAYHRQRELLAQDTTLAAERRHARIAAVEDAFSILSNPATRYVYDSERLKLPPPERKKPKRTGLTKARLTVWGTVTVLVIGTAWGYTRYAKEEERLRLEQERAAAEVATYLHDMEARDKAQLAAIDKIGSSIEREQARQSMNQVRTRSESAEPGKSDDDEVKSEMAGIKAERERVAQERRAEAGRRLR